MAWEDKPEGGGKRSEHEEKKEEGEGREREERGGEGRGGEGREGEGREGERRGGEGRGGEGRGGEERRRGEGRGCTPHSHLLPEQFCLSRQTEASNSAADVCVWRWGSGGVGE